MASFLRPLCRLPSFLTDVGEKKCRSTESYLSEVNSSLKLLTAALYNLNQIRREVSRIHVNHSALAQLCRWECEKGMAELFPFNVAKKCDENHKTMKLGKPCYEHKFPRGDQKIFKPYSYPRQTYEYRQDNSSSRRSHHSTRFREETATGKGIPQETSTINLPKESLGFIFKTLNIPEKIFKDFFFFFDRKSWCLLTGDLLTLIILTGNDFDRESNPV